MNSEFATEESCVVREELKSVADVQENHTLEIVDAKCIPSLDINILRDCVEKYFTPFMLECVDVRKTKVLKIDSFVAEVMILKATSGTYEGAGNNGIDILTPDDEAIDVVSVSTSHSGATQVGEKSLMQNFVSCGNDLDQLFAEGKDKEITALFVDGYREKMNKILPKTTFLCVFVCSQESVHLVVLKVDTAHLHRAVSGGFSKLGKSIVLSGMVPQSVGNTSIYKSKKRMEFRLCSSCVKNAKAIEIYRRKLT